MKFKNIYAMNLNKIMNKDEIVLIMDELKLTIENVQFEKISDKKKFDKTIKLLGQYKFWTQRLRECLMSEGLI